MRVSARADTFKYSNSLPYRYTTMESRLYRTTLLALYQFSLLLGILMMPLALVARKVGLTLPVHRLVARLGDAYERAGGTPR